MPSSAWALRQTGAEESTVKPQLTRQLKKVSAGQEENPSFQKETAARFGIDASFSTAQGGRPAWQDRHALITIGGEDGRIPAGVAAIVADGSGEMGAEVAEYLTTQLSGWIQTDPELRKLLDQYNAARPSSRPNLLRSIQTVLETQIRQINKKIIGGFEGRGTSTLALALVVSSTVITVSAGDSRVYWSRGQTQFQLLTRDHMHLWNTVEQDLDKANKNKTPTAVAREIDALIKAQSLLVRLQAVGYSALGFVPKELVAEAGVSLADAADPYLKISLSSHEFRRGDRLLVVSDGVWQEAITDKIREKMRTFGSVEDLPGLLITAAGRAEGDNKTALMLEQSNEPDLNAIVDENPLFRVNAARALGVSAAVLQQQNNRGHDQQDDYLLVTLRDSNGISLGVLAAIADGHKAEGKAAARAALELLVERLENDQDFLKLISRRNASWKWGLRFYWDYKVRRVLARKILQIDEEVFDLLKFKPTIPNEAAGSDGAAVMALTLVAGSTAFVANVGDARVYRRGRDKRFDLLTKDHTNLWHQAREDLIKSGNGSPTNLQISERVGGFPLIQKKLELLYRAMGQNPADRHEHYQRQKTPEFEYALDPEVNVVSVALDPGDKFLLVSDGVHKRTSDNALAAVMGNESPDEIVQAAMQLSSPKIKNESMDDRTGLALVTAGQEELLEFINAAGQKIVAAVLKPAGDGPFPVAFVFHGFTGNKEEPHIRRIAERLTEAGYLTVRPDFRHNRAPGQNPLNAQFNQSHGELPGYSLDGVLDDAAIVVQKLRFMEPSADLSHTVLVGHSYGGWAARRVAALSFQGDSRFSKLQVQAVADLSGVIQPRAMMLRTLMNSQNADLNRAKELLADWQRTGLGSVAPFTGQQYWLTGWDRYDASADLNAIPDTVPYLYFVGDQDNRVLGQGLDAEYRSDTYHGVSVSRPVGNFLESVARHGNAPLIWPNLGHAYAGDRVPAKAPPNVLDQTIDQILQQLPLPGIEGRRQILAQQEFLPGQRGDHASWNQYTPFYWGLFGILHDQQLTENGFSVLPRELLAVEEAAYNLMLYGNGGTIEVTRLQEPGKKYSSLMIRLIDQGPGILDPNLLLTRSIDVHQSWLQVAYQAIHSGKPPGFGFLHLAGEPSRTWIESRGSRWEKTSDETARPLPFGPYQGGRYSFRRTGDSPTKEGTVVTLIYDWPAGARSSDPWKVPYGTPVTSAGAEEQLPVGFEYQRISINSVPGLRIRLSGISALTSGSRGTDRLLEYSPRLVENSLHRPGFIKTQQTIRSAADRNKYAWSDKNDPVREYTAFRLGRAWNVNVADIVIPPADQREVLAKHYGVPPEGVYFSQLGLGYSLNDDEVRQKEEQAAYTRMLLFALRIHMYGFHRGNQSFLRDSESVRILHDIDQALSPVFNEQARFLDSLIFNMFSTNVGGAGAWSPSSPDPILALISLDELRAAFAQMNDSRELAELERQITREVEERLGSKAAARVAPLFESLNRWQGSYRDLVREFFERVYRHAQNPAVSLEQVKQAIAAGAEESVEQVTIARLENLFSDKQLVQIDNASRVNETALTIAKNLQLMPGMDDFGVIGPAVVSLSANYLLGNLVAHVGPEFQPSAQISFSLRRENSGPSPGSFLIIEYRDQNTAPWEIPIDRAVRVVGASRNAPLGSTDSGNGAGLTFVYEQAVKHPGGAFTIEALDANGQRARLMYSHPGGDPAAQEPSEKQGTVIIAKFPIPSIGYPRLSQLAEHIRKQLPAGAEERYQTVPVTQEYALKHAQELSEIDLGDPVWQKEGRWGTERFITDIRLPTGTQLKDLWMLSFVEQETPSGIPVAYVYASNGQPDISVASRYPGVFIARVSVRPDHQGNGLGKKLLLAAGRAAADSGIGPYMTLETDKENIRAQRVYESLGFEKAGERIDPKKGITFVEYQVLLRTLFQYGDKTASSGAEEMFDGFRSAAPELKTVVIGPSVARQFPQLRGLAGMEEKFVIDNGADTIVGLAEKGVTSVEYYGGLEESGRFAAMARSAQITTQSHQPTSARFLDQLREILSAAGIPENVLASGLEEFAQQLGTTAIAA